MNLKLNANKNANSKNAVNVRTFSLKRLIPTTVKSPQPAGFKDANADLIQKLSLNVFKSFEMLQTIMYVGSINAKDATIAPTTPLV